MRADETIKSIMKFRGFSYNSLAEKLGYTTASGVSEKLRRKQGMRVDKLISFVEAMDCEVIIRSKLKDREEWKLTASCEEDKED